MAETVVLTGAGGGLGLALAAALANHGFNLILNDKGISLPHFFTHYDVVMGDLRDAATISNLAKLAESRGATILINNAGIYSDTPFTEMEPEEIRSILEVNLIAPIMLTHAMWRTLQDSGGLVININSLAGLQGGVNEVAYCASKFGLRGFAEALQFDGTKDNIQVISVHLGAMKTDMSAGRPGWPNFIYPFEAATAILALCKNYVSLRVTEIVLGRRNY